MATRKKRKRETIKKGTKSKKVVLVPKGTKTHEYARDAFLTSPNPPRSDSEDEDYAGLWDYRDFVGIDDDWEAQSVANGFREVLERLLFAMVATVGRATAAEIATSVAAAEPVRDFRQHIGFVGALYSNLMAANFDD